MSLSNELTKSSGSLPRSDHSLFVGQGVELAVDLLVPASLPCHARTRMVRVVINSPRSVRRDFGAGGGIRTLEPLRDWSLSPTPLAMLGDPRVEGGRPLEALKCFHDVVCRESIRRVRTSKKPKGSGAPSYVKTLAPGLSSDLGLSALKVKQQEPASEHQRYQERANR